VVGERVEDSDGMSSATAFTDVPARLQDRARRLREQAAALSPVLAETYRRRASELDLQALLEAVWNPPIDLRITVDPWAA
jgi:hypothetical protein